MVLYTYTTTPDRIENILKLNKSRFTKSKISYLNEPISFDIETSSFYQDGEKYATMYVWGFDIFDTTIIGRTWNEFETMISKISEFYELNDEKRIIIYVHNLSYEFAWIMRRFKWKQVFAIETRKVLYCVTQSGVEFRCSYLLSGYKLETLAETMKLQNDNFDVMKLQYDYSFLRHYKTELSKDEIEYLVHDVKIVTAYIKKCIEDEAGIHNIPYTKTGYVRRMCRYRCLHGKLGKEYKEFIHGLTLDENEYNTAKWAFSGGFTHSALFKTGKVFYDVTSFDFTSSYPAVMVSEKFPMKKGVYIDHMNRDEFEKMMFSECCVCTLKISNVKPQKEYAYEFYISKSKCDEISPKNVCSNGRVVSADSITITLTSIDYRIIKKMYDFTLDDFTNFYYYESNYLPYPIIQAVLDLYEKKTTLKGVIGAESEYLSFKEMLNSLYGMCVTEILRSIVNYNFEFDSWENPTHYFEMTDDEKAKKLESANDNKNRFLFYLWGIFITAYSRRNLFYGIFECKQDYIYADTDSIKILNAKNHMKFIEEYNKNIIRKIRECLSFHKIPLSRMKPKTIKGIEKPLGVWDFDGHYIAFKTLGAKRYMYFDDNYGLHITIAGVSKTTAKKYFLAGTDEMTNEEKMKVAFFRFKHNMIIPAELTGKMIHTYKTGTVYTDKETGERKYISDEFMMNVKDYRGVEAEIHELSYIHLENAEYHLVIGNEFRELLKKIMEKPLY